VVAALVLVVTAAACDPPPENAPYWHPGTTVDATVVGPLVRISWDATTGGDPATAYQINLGTPTGTGVALVPASVKDCYISGLSPSTGYTIVVTARDAQMHWSGPLPGTKGNRKTTITTSSHGGAGPNLWCHTAVDADSDGLPNGVETNDGSYSGAGDTGTNPNNPDTDTDGITDGEEALGTGGVNLWAMGARPTHKDLLVEADWTSTPTCAAGNRPTAAVVSELAAVFAGGPVTNPDGVGGVKLIVDYGQGGVFTGGNAITHDGSHVDGPREEFNEWKAEHLVPARLGVFHYAIMVGLGTSMAENGGDDLTISGACNPVPHVVARSLLHELGHNLDLIHGGVFSQGGGSRPVNDLPNYNSIMNDAYAEGVDTDCDGDGSDDGVLDYSDGSNAPLDESDLDETIGICDGPDAGTTGDPIDWDRDGIYETSVEVDINDDDRINLIDNFGYLGVPEAVVPLHDHNDWAKISATGLRCVGPLGPSSC